MSRKNVESLILQRRQIKHNLKVLQCMKTDHMASIYFSGRSIHNSAFSPLKFEVKKLGKPESDSLELINTMVDISVTHYTELLRKINIDIANATNEESTIKKDEVS